MNTIAKDTLKKYQDELTVILDEHQIWKDDVIVSNGKIMPDIFFQIDIEVHGDWKHDHLHCDYLVEEYLKEKDFMLTGSNNQITESDETDSYSSIHTYYVCIDKDMGQKLSYLINGN